MATVQLGPFRLGEHLASGGMAEVWSGVHEAQVLPVAIKFLTGRDGLDRRLADAFRREARAVARLDHPHVIRLFDYGVLTPQQAQSLDGRFEAGSPYLVMERSFGGTLANLKGDISWRDLRKILRALLDALAHAHARAVLHRDIKPSNVLLGVGQDAGLRLADFGLTHPTSVLGDPELSGMGTLVEAGTPNYIAPETARGEWRDFGPWTDFYSLGCMAWHLATGLPPFTGNSAVAIIAAHLYQAPPAFVPQIDCPPGFEAWLRKMMQKRASERFGRAADAAMALVALGEEPPVQRPRPPKRGSETLISPGSVGASGDTTEEATTQRVAGQDLVPTGRMHIVTTTNQFAVDLVRAAASALDQEEAPRRPSVPEDWRPGGVQRTTLRLADAGLGLCPLRAPALVGRDEECDLLWRELALCSASGQARAVLLEGEPGIGKSRLAEWLAQRGHELGVSVGLKAQHSAQGGVGEGLSGMLAHHFCAQGLDREKLLERLDKSLSSDPSKLAWDDAASLSELIIPSASDERYDSPRQHRFTGNHERYARILREIQRLAHERTVLFWLDDVQWGPDSLGFVNYVMSNRERHGCAALFVMTLNGSQGAQDDVVARHMETLRATPNCNIISLAPLDEKATAELLRGVLPLEKSLESEVLERVSGNPMFSVELIRSWAEQGLLQAGDGGFTAGSGEGLSLPDSIHSTWSRRLGAALQGLPEGEDRMLQVAAVLGPEFRVSEWSELCQTGEGGEPSRLAQHLLHAGLLIGDEQGHRLQFAHRLLQESVVKEARDQGRLVGLHAAAAQLLRKSNLSTDLPRRAHHLVEAGERDRALPVFEEAARTLRASGESTARRLLVDRWRRALDVLAPPPSDSSWGAYRLELLRDNIHQTPRDCQEASAHFERDVREHGWSSLLPRAMECRIFEAMARGDYDDVLAATERALEDPDDLPLRVVAHAMRAQALVWLGEKEGARHAAAAAVDESRRAAVDAPRMLVPLSRLAIALVAVDELDQAVEVLDTAASLARSRGALLVLAELQNHRGEILRRRSQTEEAREAYQASYDLWVSANNPAAGLVQLNLATLALESSDFSAAAEGFELSLKPTHAFSSLTRTISLLGLAACSASAGDKERYISLLADAQSEDFLQSDHREVDVAVVAEIAAQQALKRGWSSQASEAMDVARAQRRDGQEA